MRAISILLYFPSNARKICYYFGMLLIHVVVLGPMLDTFVASMNNYWKWLREEPDDVAGLKTREEAAQTAFTTLYNQTKITLAQYLTNPFHLELLKFVAPPSLPDIEQLARIRAIFGAQARNTISPI